jgi:hypothetical protein
MAHAATYSFVLGPDRDRTLFLADDSLISLRYAERFVNGQGLTWNDNEPRVEGYSNLLWILLISALGKCGVDLILAGRILGCLGMAAVIAAVVYAYLPRRPTDERAPPLSASLLPPLAAALALALTGPIAVWAIGGLEQPLLAALLAWALVLLLPLFDGQELPASRTLAPGLLLALAVLTRPDAPLFTAVICLCLPFVRGLGRKSILLAAGLAALPVLFYLGQLGFRLSYYGDWVPNSAHAKVALTFQRMEDGLKYVGLGLVKLVPLLAPAAAAVVGARLAGVRRGRTLVLTALVIVWSLYLIVIGGDIFPGWRHLVVIAMASALLAAGGIEWALSHVGPRRGIVWTAVLALLVTLGYLQYADKENDRARREQWEWDGQVVGNLLKRAFGPQQPLLAVDPAGCLPYFSGLPSIDMLGINDRYLATHPPADFGQGLAGHDLGDGDYVLGRNPDLVLFTGPQGGLQPRFRSAREMWRDPRFVPTFEPVLFEGSEPRSFRSLIWVRREGGRIGIQREGNRVTVPGFLLAPAHQLQVPLTGDPQGRTVAVGMGVLDGAGAMGCLVRTDVPYVLPRLPLGPGRWRITISPPAPGIWLAARVAGPPGDLNPHEGQCNIAVPTGGDGEVDVTVTAMISPGVHVRNLLLENLD